jgi:sarcosine oxidase subunit gamma
MSATLRQSPLHDALLPLQPQWKAIHGMPAPLRLPGDGATPPLALSDASCLPRMGVKGPQAEQWLRSQGVEVPLGVNAWTRGSDGLLVARLARSEFFLEDRMGGTSVERLSAALRPAPGVYPVTRQDAALVLTGTSVNELLVQTCNVDFQAWRLEQRTVVMTSMVGVSVLVLWYSLEQQPCYRIWCDGTFGPYLWETLLEIARELGGGAIGLESLFPDIKAGR